MKNKMLMVTLLCWLPLASDAGIMKDFESLGGNDVLLEKAKALQPDQKIDIVQNRIFDRHLKSEFNLETGLVAGGDAYLKTQNYGIAYNFHLTPRWSFGARYSLFANQLSDEGKSLISKNNLIPDMDQPLTAAMGVINWYPIYGKINLHELAITHFDVYLLAGYGSIQLKSGWTDTYAAGGGIAFWISQHLSARLEGKYQHYQAHRLQSNVGLNTALLSFAFGYML